jgi:hypothetical protein
VTASGVLKTVINHPDQPAPGCSNEDYACYANYTLNKKRQELDPKMAELYANTGTIRGVNNVHYDSTMLSGVIWAMLGTTVLYYAFTKM